MPISQRIRDYLESHLASYELLHHPRAFTGQEVAHSLHLSGKRLAKTVVLKVDGRLVMAVMPASHRLNLQELRATLEVDHLEMVPESELPKLFPDCDLGAVPPLGKLYGIDVCVDRAVADSEEIVFCAGTHEDCIRMKFSDFERLVVPRLGRFSEVWLSRAA